MKYVVSTPYIYIYIYIYIVYSIWNCLHDCTSFFKFSPLITPCSGIILTVNSNKEIKVVRKQINYQKYVKRHQTGLTSCLLSLNSFLSQKPILKVTGRPPECPFSFLEFYDESHDSYSGHIITLPERIPGTDPQTDRRYEIKVMMVKWN